MVVYAVEVLFKTKMDADVDETYEKEHKKEINKVSREMAKFIETMRTEEQKKFRIGGNAPTLVFRAMKQFGVEEPVPEKKTKTKKTKKDAAAPAEPIAEPEPATPVYEQQVAAEPAEPVAEKKTKKTKTAKPKKEEHANADAKEDAAAAPAPENNAEAEPKTKPKSKAKKAAAKTETETETDNK